MVTEAQGSDKKFPLEYILEPNILQRFTFFVKSYISSETFINIRKPTYLCNVKYNQNIAILGQYPSNLAVEGLEILYMYHMIISSHCSL